MQMLSTETAFSSDLLDLQFVLRPTPVLSHPLLFDNRTKNATLSAVVSEQELSVKAEATEERRQKDTANGVNANKDDGRDNNGGAETWQSFVDPLNAAATVGANAQQSPSKKTAVAFANHQNGIHNLPGVAFETVILTNERLANTLAEHDTEQWPLEGLDPPDLVGHRPWRVLRQHILDTFSSATDRLSFESSFLGDGEASMRAKGTETAHLAERRQLRKSDGGGGTERRRQKILVTEQRETTTKFHELSQDEWTRKMKELRRILTQKWEEEKRLECIKLCAEVAALISTNISSAQFYPSQFVHVTDFLDLFGLLVYQRLLNKAAEERRAVGLGALSAHFDTNDVLEETRVKARNWFGKVNETVALLAPRIYLLTALLPCQRFMDPAGAVQENLLELCQSVRQVQHPLIASYLRCYICRVAMRLDAANRAPHWKCLNDWLQTYTQQPTFLLGPAMEWVVQCVAFNAVSYADLHPLWEYCRLPERRPVVLLPMLNALPRLYLGEHSLEACRIVTASEMVSGEELCVLGTNLLETDVPVQNRKPILKAVWKCVMRLASLKHYMACCECWVEFVARYFGTNELDVMLDSMLAKLNQQQQQQDKYTFYQHQLLAILQKVFAHSRDIAAIFAMDVFSKFVDSFSTGPIRAQVFLIILRAIVSKHSVASFTDIDLAYQVLSLCQSLHDCVEPSSSDGHVEMVTGLISASLDRVDISANPDQCLDFLVSCRANLANLDGLQQYVLCRVQAFTLHIVRSVRYSNSRAAFLQGCLANLFISIPSLVDPLDQIRFGIHSTQIALAALAFFQVNSFVVSILDTFDGLPRPAALLPRVLQLGTDFLATLVQIPQQLQNEEDDNDETTDGRPNAELRRQPLRHFRRFLQFVLRTWHDFTPYAIPPNVHNAPGVPQLDFVRLLIRCLHYLCVIWPTGSRSLCAVSDSDQNDQSLLFRDDAITQRLLQQNGHLQDDEGEEDGQLQSICTQFAEQIADALEPHLMDENASDEMCSVGVELLELVSQFGPTDSATADDKAAASLLPDALLTLSKAIYKQCRRKSALIMRIRRMAKRK